MKGVDGLKRLGLPPEAKPSQVEAAWREQRGPAHPDHGGTAEAFHTLREAYVAAKLWTERDIVCRTCDGTGRRTIRGGFSRTTMLCRTCRGTRIQPKEPS